MDRVLDKVIAVFSEQGYHGTSISNLVSATGLTSGSLYKAFGDKRGVFAAAVGRYETLQNDRMTSMMATAPTGRGRVRAMLLSYAETSHGMLGRRGCFLIGGTIELSSTDPKLARKMAGTFSMYERRFADAIRFGQKDGSIPKSVEADFAARLLLCVVQGMRVIGKTGRAADEIDDIVFEAMKIIS